MRITVQVLREKLRSSLKSAEHLDLSYQSIDRIERLQFCPRLTTVILRGNQLNCVNNLEHNSQIWHLDLSCNKISNLDGLEPCIALGTLMLSNNNLTWSDLAKIRHIHVLNLTLHGNRVLDQDPYSAEREQVKQFFNDSALTKHPVRHKLSSQQFKTSAAQIRDIKGVFGERTAHLMRRFPVNEALNIDTDLRRLKYLAINFEKDLVVSHKARLKPLENFSQAFESLLESRKTDCDHANMLLLLIVASLQFAIPATLMQHALEYTKLDGICEIPTMEFFTIAKEYRCLIASLLLSAIKLDKDQGKDGGVYNKLYLALYYSVAEITRLSQLPKHMKPKRPSSLVDESRTLIASEVVHLLLIVPSFYNYVSKDAGIGHLVAVATNTPNIVDQINETFQRSEGETLDDNVVVDMVGKLVSGCLCDCEQNVLHTKDNPATSYVLNTHAAFPRKTLSAGLRNCEFHLKGCPTPRTDFILTGNQAYVSNKGITPKAKLGEKVLLGPQNAARIVSIPEPDILLVQMTNVPGSNGAFTRSSHSANEHFTYVDMKDLYWDFMGRFWRPKAFAADRIVLRSGPSDVVIYPTGETPAESIRKMPSPEPSPRNLASLTVSPRHREELLANEETSVNFLSPKRHPTESALRPLSARITQRLRRAHHSAPPTGRQHLPWNEEKEKEFQLLFRCRIPHGADDVVQSATKRVLKNMSMEHRVPSPIIVTEPIIEEIETADKSSSLESVEVDISIQPKVTKPEIEVTKSPQSPAPIEIPQVDDVSDSCGALTRIPPQPHPSINDATTVTTETESSCVDEVTEQPNGSTEAEEVVEIMEEKEITLEISEAETKLDIKSSQDDETVSSSRKAGKKSSESHSSGDASDRSAKYSHLSSRQFTIDAFKALVVDDSFYSPYQLQRTESWRGPSNNRNSYDLPPQRPCSPVIEEGIRGKRIFRTPSIPVQRGEKWLAGGRNIHSEGRHSRPRTATHTPGWKVGAAALHRPKSAAERAAKRNSTPRITTPSSIAHQQKYGRGVAMARLEPPSLQASTDKLENTLQCTQQVRSSLNAVMAWHSRQTALASKQRPDVICSECIRKEMDDEYPHVSRPNSPEDNFVTFAPVSYR